MGGPVIWGGLLFSVCIIAPTIAKSWEWDRVNTAAAVKVFKAKYNISRDIFIEYFSKGNIEDRRVSRVVFIPLMAILKGRVRFLLNPLLLGTLRFYGFSPNQ